MMKKPTNSSDRNYNINLFEALTPVILLVILLAAGILFFLLKKWLKKSIFYEKGLSFIDGLKEGFKSIKNMKIM